MSNSTEILLPVGSMEMLLAAIHGGADAVYIGAPSFNARGRSQDFSITELEEMIKLAHLYGVKVHLALNVVIFETEIDEVIELIYQLVKIGPDAFIVQDLGVAKILREISPDIVIHGSTQMTVTNHEAITLLDDLNIKRFVLGRENSISEIKLIREKTDKELEVFIHGALCVAYSGQCFTSESIGGRSANRGQCAQSCRLDYEMLVDHKTKTFVDKKYFVSPKDLCGINEAGTLQEIGVNSLKIEGRLKGPGYVMSTAKEYRRVLDGKSMNMDQAITELAMEYSRGFFSGWLHGVDHQQLVEGTYSEHRGIEIAKVERIVKNKIFLLVERELKAGQGILLVKGKEEFGGKIFEVKKEAKFTVVTLVNQKSIPEMFLNGRVFLNSDDKQEKELKKLWTMREFKKRIPFNLEIKVHADNVEFVIECDSEKFVLKSFIQSSADSRFVSTHKAIEELSALSHTAFRAQVKVSEALNEIPLEMKEIKEIKNQIITGLNDKRTTIPKLSLKNKEHLSYFNNTTVQISSQEKTGLNLVLRNAKQVDVVSLLQYPEMINLVTLDFEFGKDYLSSVEKLKNKGMRVAIATTRILKPQEYYNFKIIERANPDEILVRNLGAINYFKNKNFSLRGDFSLNVSNSISFQYLIDKGLSSINLSYDMNQDQLYQMIKKLDQPSKAEVTIHQYMPEFHMEHCVFAAFLSKGSSFKDCGKPCEVHSVELKDPYGNMHILKADQECRNTMFRATPQSASFLIEDLKALGVSLFRFEALNEENDVLAKKINLYCQLFLNQISTTDLTHELLLNEKYGLTSGQLMKKDNYKNIKKDFSSLDRG